MNNIEDNPNYNRKFSLDFETVNQNLPMIAWQIQSKFKLKSFVDFSVFERFTCRGVSSALVVSLSSVPPRGEHLKVIRNGAHMCLNTMARVNDFKIKT